MKFSSLEQDVIRDLCAWARDANVFRSTRLFFKDVAIKNGTGLFVFSKEEEGRPPIILCINLNTYSVEEYDGIYNDVLFKLHFLRKLEQLGLITISEGRYSQEKEYAIALFKDVVIPSIRRSSGDEWGYYFQFSPKGCKPIDAELVQTGLTLRTQKGVALPYFTEEVFSRFDAYSLVSSNIALEQELFDLKDHEFKTDEEQMLETADNQLTTAKDILTQAKEQSKLALADMNQAKTNFETAQKYAREQFDEEQKNANQRFVTEQANAQKNLEFTQAELDRRFKESQEASERQYQDSRKESKRQFEEAQKESKRQFDEAQKESKRQFEEAQKESREQFGEAQKDSKRALWLAALSIIASPFVAKYVHTTIDEGQIDQIGSLQTEILNKLEEINVKVVEAETDTTLYVVPVQLDEISTTLKKVNNKLVKPAQK